VKRTLVAAADSMHSCVERIRLRRFSNPERTASVLVAAKPAGTVTERPTNTCPRQIPAELGRLVLLLL
jgi:hypothetical protein